MKKVAFIKLAGDSHWVGNGFPVKNIFSYSDIAHQISPFLHLDYVEPITFPPTNDRLGVGEHPHRGFETVTIVYEGGVTHRDSSGNGGTIGAGDVQWMTAGGGITHEEYHSLEYASRGGMFQMIQLWVNLPAKDKMVNPSYQALDKSNIPLVELAQSLGVVRVIAGTF